MMRMVLTGGSVAILAGTAFSVLGLVSADISILGPVLIAACFSAATLGLCAWMLQDEC